MINHYVERIEDIDIDSINYTTNDTINDNDLFNLLNKINDILEMFSKIKLKNVHHVSLLQLDSYYYKKINLFLLAHKIIKKSRPEFISDNIEYFNDLIFTYIKNNGKKISNIMNFPDIVNTFNILIKDTKAKCMNYSTFESDIIIKSFLINNPDIKNDDAKYESNIEYWCNAIIQYVGDFGRESKMYDISIVNALKIKQLWTIIFDNVLFNNDMVFYAFNDIKTEDTTILITNIIYNDAKYICTKNLEKKSNLEAFSGGSQDPEKYYHFVDTLDIIDQIIKNFEENIIKIQQIDLSTLMNFDIKRYGYDVDIARLASCTLGEKIGFETAFRGHSITNDGMFFAYRIKDFYKNIINEQTFNKIMEKIINYFDDIAFNDIKNLIALIILLSIYYDIKIYNSNRQILIQKIQKIQKNQKNQKNQSNTKDCNTEELFVMCILILLGSDDEKLLINFCEKANYFFYLKNLIYNSREFTENQSNKKQKDQTEEEYSKWQIHCKNDNIYLSNFHRMKIITIMNNNEYYSNENLYILFNLIKTMCPWLHKIKYTPYMQGNDCTTKHHLINGIYDNLELNRVEAFPNLFYYYTDNNIYEEFIIDAPAVYYVSDKKILMEIISNNVYSHQSKNLSMKNLEYDSNIKVFKYESNIICPCNISSLTNMKIFRYGWIYNRKNEMINIMTNDIIIKYNFDNKKAHCLIKSH